MDDTISKDGLVLPRLIYSITKRLFDIIVGLLGIVLLVPVTIIIKLACIVTKDYAPIFYSHVRIGKNGKEFKLYKFRSMVPNADAVLMEMLKDKKIANVAVKLSTDEAKTFFPNSNRGRIYYANYPKSQNVISGGKIVNTEIDKSYMMNVYNIN